MSGKDKGKDKGNKTVINVNGDQLCIDRNEPFVQQVIDHQKNKSKQSDTIATAIKILENASDCIGDRATERDTDSERSMASTIKAFNGMFDTNLTERQGWQFMVLLKMSRSKAGSFKLDDFIDGAAYSALAGECTGDKQ